MTRRPLIDRHLAVVWDEGMLLSPQHFQQWDRHLEHRMRQLGRMLRPFDWGWAECVVDADALQDQRLALARGTGVFRDGTPFRMPQDEPLPESISLDERFGPQTDAVQVHLGLPKSGPDRAMVGNGKPAGDALHRFQTLTLDVPDANSARNPRSISAAVPNLHFVFEGPAKDDFETLPLARIVRATNGGFRLDDTFAPPCLTIGGSDRLRRVLRGIQDLVEARAHAREEQRGDRWEPFHASSSTSALQLYALNEHRQGLAHLLRQEHTRPEEVYRELATLAAKLATFSSKVGLKDLPPYDHERPAEVSIALGEVIRGLTESDRSDIESVPLVRDGIYQLVQRLEPHFCGATSQLYLTVRSDLEDAQVIATSSGIKIASRDQIERLIAYALPGIPLHYEATFPPGLAQRDEELCFRLDESSPLMAGVRASQTLAIFLPPSFNNTQLRLFGKRA